jgi:hypothetical protein
MALFSVFTRDTEDPMPRLVADRFAWSAALFPPLYLLGHGLWLGLVGFLLFAAALAGLSFWLGPDATFWLYVSAALLFGFEAPALVRRKLRRKGFAHAGERFAADRDVAASDWLASRDGAS